MRRILAIFGTAVVLWLVVLLTLFRSSATSEPTPLTEVVAEVDSVGPVQRLRRLQQLKAEEAARQRQAGADAGAQAQGDGSETSRGAAAEDADEAAGAGVVAEATERGSAHCEPWCVSPCAELNGNVYDECRACGADFRCRLGAEGMPTAAEAAAKAKAKAAAPNGGAAAEEEPLGGEEGPTTEGPTSEPSVTSRPAVVKGAPVRAAEEPQIGAPRTLDVPKSDPTPGDVVLLTANGRVRLQLQPEAAEARRYVSSLLPMLRRAGAPALAPREEGRPLRNGQLARRCAPIARCYASCASRRVSTVT